MNPELGHKADAPIMYTRDQLVAACAESWNKAVEQTCVDGRFTTALCAFGFGLFCAWLWGVL